MKRAKILLSASSPTLGCDPEFFLASKGELLGSEEVIPKDGLKGNEGGGITRDGIQAEMQVSPFSCRQSGGYYITNLFQSLRGFLTKDAKKDYELDWNVLHEVPEKKLQALSKESRVLGCAPSLNLYDPEAAPGVDGEVYPYRSAGGHIHIGLVGGPPWSDEAKKTLIALMDILVGNTAVLIDRDEGNIERRKVYGRAGEYRLPKHGVEYRSLSNFWLRHFTIFHLVFGLTRMAYSAVLKEYFSKAKQDSRTFKYTWEKHPDYQFATALLEAVDQGQIIEAINTNDLDLAWANWKAVRGWIEEYVPDGVGGFGYEKGPAYSTGSVTRHSSNMGIAPSTLDDFEFFAREIQEKGLKTWFKADPMSHWCAGTQLGSESFLAYNVRKRRLKSEDREEDAA
jgi:hypothetical protein